MDDNRALYWIGVAGLIAVGLLLGQSAPVVIAASVALFLAYEQLLKRSSTEVSEPSVRVS